MDPRSAKTRRGGSLLAGTVVAVLALLAAAQLFAPSDVAGTGPPVRVVTKPGADIVAGASSAIHREGRSAPAAPREPPVPTEVETTLQHADQARLTRPHAASMRSRHDDSMRGDRAFAVPPSRPVVDVSAEKPAATQRDPEVIYHGPLAVENVARSPAPQHVRPDAEAPATTRHRDIERLQRVDE